MYPDQSTLDAAFADLDSLLAERAPEVQRGCVNCGGDHFERRANAGQGIQYYCVCSDCGAIRAETYGMCDTLVSRRPTSSNYKRIHHWHERVSQLLLCESQIPDDDMVAIAASLCDGTHAVINKDIIRSVLRSLNKQVYIERWLQIIQRITGIEPPKPGGQMLLALDDMFVELQRPFSQYKHPVRKNFLNYNYVFCRMFQKLGCEQFSMFFPLIKSKAKLKVLDETWVQMIGSIGWPVTPLAHVPPFAVRLERPAYLLQRLRQQVDARALAAMHTTPERTEFRKSDQHLLRELNRQRSRAQSRSDRPAPVLQRPVKRTKRTPPVLAAAPLPMRRSKHQPRLA